MDKITAAIIKAFKSINRKYYETVIDFMALKVTADFELKIQNGIIQVEDIQDSVESVLIQAGFTD